jgi:hypothetical protein
MRLIAVSKVLDEADIIEAFVRHTAAFVSHQIILDNGSCDGTVEILKHLRDEGLHLTLLQNHCRQFNEKKLNTVLYHLAVQLGAPDWVLFLDADEFIDDGEAVRGGGGLAALLERQPAEVLCVHVLLSHYQASIWDNLNEPIIPVRLSWRQERRAVEKAMVRGNLAARNVDILPGNHGAEVDGQPCPYRIEPAVTLAHYAERSPFQAIVKFIRGWSKVLAAGESEVRIGTSNHYREPFQKLRDRPQDMLRSPWLHRFSQPTDGLIHDPIAYRGTSLRFTPTLDEPMRAVRCLVRTIETVSQQHGRLLEECPEARVLATQWSEDIQIL